MKTALSLLVVAALAGCAGAPVSSTVCDNLPIARAVVDSAIARGERKMTKQDKADLAAVRAVEDAKCAQAASAAG